MPSHTILVVDDSPLYLHRLTSILETQPGMQVYGYHSAREALAWAQAHHPDLILLDIQMPEMDGYEFCQCIKRSANTSGIPIIFVSSDNRPEDKVKAFEAGGVDYVIKPFHAAEILARVKTHLTLGNLQQQLEIANHNLAQQLTELTRSQAAQRESEEILRAFVRAHPDTAFIHDEVGRYVEVISVQEDLLPVPLDQIKGRLVQDILPPEVSDMVLIAIQQTLATEHNQVIEYQMQVKAGLRWFEGRTALLSGDITQRKFVVLVSSDITERVQLYEEVQRMAAQDPLTGCYNRRHFLSLANQEFEHSLRYDRPLALVMIDIDFFKRVNDHYGHPVGDQVLRQLVNHCQTHLRKVDVVGRYGGEEFLLLLPETSQVQAFMTAERLRSEIAGMQIATPQGDLSITISLGVASARPGIDKNLDPIIQRADDALYRAKAGGRNRVCD